MISDFHNFHLTHSSGTRHQQHHYHHHHQNSYQDLRWNPFMSWFVLIASFSWLSSYYRQVSCLFQQSSMEARSCSDFRLEDYPQIAVKHGDQEYDASFAIDEDKLLNHEMFYFKCVAKYPIEWISNEPSATTVMHHYQSPSGALRAATAHLHIYRTFSNFSDHNTYRFGITTRVRYTKERGFKQINGTCRSVVKPYCLSRSIYGLEDFDGVALNISIDPPSSDQEQFLSSSSSGMLGTKEMSTLTFGFHRKEAEDVREDNCDYKIYYVGERANGSRFSFFCEEYDGTPSSITFIHQCSNTMTCLNLFRNSRLPSRCAQPMERHNTTCAKCEGKQLRISQGVIGCDSSFGDEEDAHSRAKRLLFFFTSLPHEGSQTKLYFRMEDAKPSEMMRLSEVPDRVYLGEQLTISCNVSNYYFAGGTRLALKFADVKMLTFLKTMARNFDSADQFGGSIIETTIPITSVNLERVYCFAPVWNSFEWTNQSRVINVKEKISGDIIVAVSVTIFLTALLVATMFGILWVKVGKKHGRMNLLTASEIEEFRKGSVSDEHKPIKLLSTVDTLAYGTNATYDPVYEIKRERLLLDETAILGHGHFGLVMKGAVRESQSDMTVDVAVKTLKTKVDVGSLKALLSELKILASIGKHTNIVNLVGACTKKMIKGEVYVAVEYCANGNLQNFLRQQRQTFRSQLENDVLVIETPIRKLSTSSESLMTIDLIKWAWETAKGMEFLGSKKIIHGDLATRNILLTADFVAKVSDFGLSRQLVDYYYVQKETGPMPWKWMSLEALRDMKFSIQSDVWSFGVTLWELFTLAETPYSGCSWSAEFVETLAQGHRLGKPKFATSEMYDLMRECWKHEPSGRPSFFAIKMFFEDILTQCTSQDYMQLTPSMTRTTIPEESEYQHQPLLQSSRIIIEEEGEDDVFE